ncbi:hypothetical protein GGI24_005122, partial [Coemansia furcata]
MAYPVVMSVVRNKEYEREWLLRLRTDGLQDMYEANLNLRVEGPVCYARMNSPATNQREKNLVEVSGRDSRYFDMQQFGRNGEQEGADREVVEGYRASEEATAIPQSRGTVNGRHFDTRS